MTPTSLDQLSGGEWMPSSCTVVKKGCQQPPNTKPRPKQINWGGTRNFGGGVILAAIDNALGFNGEMGGLSEKSAW